MDGKKLQPGNVTGLMMSLFTTATFFVTAVISFTEAAAEQVSELQTQTDYKEWSVILVAVVSAAVLLIIVAYALANCTDCYNSEVSSEFHPASASGGAKWGGAGGYSAAATADVGDRVLGAGFTGEVIQPGEGGSHALPYAMIPSQVPEAQGFRGYGPVEPAGAPQPGLSGYSAPGGGGPVAGYGGDGGGQWGGAGQQGMGTPSRLPGAHSNPMEAQEPPPSYFDTSYH